MKTKQKLLTYGTRSVLGFGVSTLDRAYIGHVVKEATDKIVVFGDMNLRFDFPKSLVKIIGKNVLLDINEDQAGQYVVPKTTPLPA